MFWYQMHQACIKWGKTTSSFFSISNGVRQGGILSPRLFSLYMDNLTEKLISCRSGCYINDSQSANHVLYADDICLFAPSAAALQDLLNVCYDYGLEHDIKFLIQLIRLFKIELHCL